MHSPLILRMIIMTACGVSLFAAGGYGADIRDTPGPTVSVQLVDASTTQPARNAAVRLLTENRLRCERAPCPVDGKTWKARSDRLGFVTLPTNLLHASTTIATNKLSGDLIEDSVADAQGVWIAELLPQDWRYECPPAPAHPLKLIDATTGRGIADAPVNFEFRQDADARFIFSSRTNTLGYVLLPGELPAGAIQNTWVVVGGYRTTHIDFAWAQHRTRLVRQVNHARVARQ